jgi:hypothetical protein
MLRSPRSSRGVSNHEAPNLPGRGRIRISDSDVKQPFEDTRPRTRPAPTRPSYSQDRTLEIEGRRECRVKASPAAPCIIKSTGKEPQGSAESSGIPCAMVLTLMACSPWEPGFLAPITRSVRHARELGLSVGRPGPHDFASASASSVRAHKARATPSRPPHPALTFGDDPPSRPFHRGGMRTPYF